MRLIHKTETINGHQCRVYYAHEWAECVVRFYINGKHMKRADYHTDDRTDAINTADHSVYGKYGNC